MRALLVTHYYAEHRGGIELVAREMAERFIRRSVEVVWAASDEPGEIGDQTVPRLPMRAWNITERVLGFAYPFWGPIGLARLFSAVRRADVVHLHDALYMGNVFAFLCAKAMGKPVVVTQHVGTVPYSRKVLRGLLALANRSVARGILGRSERSVFISMKVQRYFSEFVNFRSAPRYIPNGLATEVFHPLDEAERTRRRTSLRLPLDSPVMLFVGRFVEQKGLKLLRDLVARFPECQWVFVGWGPLDPAAWDAPNVSCPGKLDRAELVPYFQTADLLVLPSVGEGFPAVVQQSLACGTPALISEDTARGMPEIAPLVFVSDVTVDGLAETLRRVLEPGSLNQARREEAARFAQAEWNWERCIDLYERMFNELAGGRGSHDAGALTIPDPGGCSGC